MGVLKGVGLSDRQPIETIENCSVYYFASSSRPGKRHTTILLPLQPGQDVQTRCSCEGFMNYGYCWHSEWVLENA